MEKENKIKNKIITISGEPVTGKGTTVKDLTDKLIKRGYKEDDVHVIITGHEFRDLFFVLLDFISHLEDEKKLMELSEKDEIAAILEDSEYRIKLLSTIAKLQSKGITVSPNITIEQANNMPELTELRSLVDTIIDKKTAKLGEEINQSERPNDVWIIDSRLAFQNIPDSFSVRLTCMPYVAGKRLIGDNTRGKEDSNYENLQAAISQREKRRLGEIARYKERYKVDLTDEKNYDLVIDTSFSTVDDISNTILQCLDRCINEEYFPKRWAAPKMMLPLQGERETLFPSLCGYSIDDMSKSIRDNGYDCNYPLEVYEVDGIKYIREGHHRNFAMGYLGHTLIPYDVLRDTDYDEEKRKEITNRVPNGKYLFECMTGHEWIIEIGDRKRENNKDLKFSYKEVYPELYDRLYGEIVENRDISDR